MAELPPELRENDPPPGASWFRALRDYLRSLRLTVDGASGLELSYGPSGATLRLRPGLRPCFAITSTAVDAYNPTTKELGQGTAALYRVAKVGTGKAKLVAVGGPPVTIYSADPAAAGVASGRLVQLKPIDGFLVIDVDYCGA